MEDPGEDITQPDPPLDPGTVKELRDKHGIKLPTWKPDPSRLKELNDKEFEKMVEPSLPDRLRAFEAYLSGEPCTHPGNPETFGELVRPADKGGCMVISITRNMCPACRLRTHFYHCIYNAEAYEGGPGEIPRLRSL